MTANEVLNVGVNQHWVLCYQNKINAMFAAMFL